jgi:hypothetical protein
LVKEIGAGASAGAAAGTKERGLAAAGCLSLITLAVSSVASAIPLEVRDWRPRAYF